MYNVYIYIYTLQQVGMVLILNPPNNSHIPMLRFFTQNKVMLNQYPCRVAPI